ncbi:MAG: hypothetical protein PHG82_03915 [Candidatus Gracilibacteria bacterium]|nr:hypothetical protein [Candidatus Gracilibacteria bacterium]
MKKGQQEVYPLKMNAKEIFALFNSVAFPEIEFIDSRNVILFEVDSLRAILQIEKALLKSVLEYNPKGKADKLVSNKRKPLFLKASLLSNPSGIDLWQFHIYQEHAQGIVIETNISLNSYADIGAELSVVLLMLTDRYHREQFSQKMEREFKMFKHEQMLLKKEDLEYFLTIDYITSPERNQVLYTFEYYKSQKDEYPEMIELLSQHQAAIANNAKIQIILDLCKECFEKFDFCPTIQNPAGCGAFFIYLMNQ